MYSQIKEKSKGYLRVSLCVQVCIIIMAQPKQFGCRWNGGWKEAKGNGKRVIKLLYGSIVVLRMVYISVVFGWVWKEEESSISFNVLCLLINVFSRSIQRPLKENVTTLYVTMTVGGW